MEKVKVYVSCALTCASVRYKQQIAAFIAELEQVEWVEIFRFVDSLDGVVDTKKDPLHIYTNDIHGCVGKVDAVIGELSLPSTGLGWELAIAAEKHSIRTLMCAKANKKVSYLPRGAALYQDHSHVTFHWYNKKISELLPYFLSELKQLYEK